MAMIVFSGRGLSKQLLAELFSWSTQELNLRFSASVAQLGCVCVVVTSAGTAMHSVSGPSYLPLKPFRGVMAALV